MARSSDEVVVGQEWKYCRCSKVIAARASVLVILPVLEMQLPWGRNRRAARSDIILLRVVLAPAYSSCATVQLYLS